MRLIYLNIYFANKTYLTVSAVSPGETIVRDYSNLCSAHSSVDDLEICICVIRGLQSAKSSKHKRCISGLSSGLNWQSFSLMRFGPFLKAQRWLPGTSVPRGAINQPGE